MTRRVPQQVVAAVIIAAIVALVLFVALVRSRPKATTALPASAALPDPDSTENPAPHVGNVAPPAARKVQPQTDGHAAEPTKGHENSAPNAPAAQEPSGARFFPVGSSDEFSLGETIAEALLDRLGLTAEQLGANDEVVDLLADAASRAMECKRQIGNAGGQRRGELKDSDLSPEFRETLMAEARQARAQALAGDIIAAYRDASAALELLRPYVDEKHTAELDRMLAAGRKEMQYLLQGETRPRAKLQTMGNSATEYAAKGD
ncbi:MAG: hypothetical protein JXL80_11360 [Planctomycetes bacterium]|nr:hypothetical protein [Planctomycetota bacterium]